MKKKPDITVSRGLFLYERRKVCEKIPCRGVYVFRYNKTVIYVGASMYLDRAFRVFTTENVGTRFLNTIVKYVGRDNIVIDFYGHKGSLRFCEKFHHNRLNPISQFKTGYKTYKQGFLSGK